MKIEMSFEDFSYCYSNVLKQLKEIVKFLKSYPAMINPFVRLVPNLNDDVFLLSIRGKKIDEFEFDFFSHSIPYMRENTYLFTVSNIVIPYDEFYVLYV